MKCQSCKAFSLGSLLGCFTWPGEACNSREDNLTCHSEEITVQIKCITADFYSADASFFFLKGFFQFKHCHVWKANNLNNGCFSNFNKSKCQLWKLPIVLMSSFFLCVLLQVYLINRWRCSLDFLNNAQCLVLKQFCIRHRY